MMNGTWQTMKCFRLTEAERWGVAPFSVIRWMKRGVYRGAIRIRRKNARVVLVQVVGDLPADPHGRRHCLGAKYLGLVEYQRRRRVALYARGLTARGTPRKYRTRRQKL